MNTNTCKAIATCAIWLGAGIGLVFAPESAHINLIPGATIATIAIWVFA